MSEAKLKPCPLCGSTNIRMLENLVRAGALVLAEIERLDRSATEQGSTCCKGSA
ncbi:hypothetical protein [Pseudomonas aeruginosa]|uniref:hypothetical protein n=1 Tax=Pseudomonas aeruginosa TaxID=287 RepID=UPI001469C8A2|nr:hypothetical protein [Pseudomonas aeruginosa]